MTSRRIEGHKNYYDLMLKHEKARKYGQLLKVLKWLLFFGALLTVIIYYINSSNPSATTLEALQDGSFEVFEVDASTGGSIVTKRGSEIIVPVNAFVDHEGKTVDKTVTIYYKEYRDAVDIALSDIPMHLTGKYMLESAGMFTIHAYQKTHVLEPHQDNVIRVNYLGKRHGEGYNNYYLNKNQQWVRVRPEIKHTRFKILGNTEHFPELKALENVEWEFSEEPSDSVLNVFFNEVWTYPDLSKNEDSYSLYCDVLVEKVVNLSYGADTAIFKPRLESLESELDSIEEVMLSSFTLKDSKSPSGFYEEFRRLKERQKIRKTQPALLNVTPMEAVEPYLENEAVMNSFYITNFGTWNCDRPFPVNEYITLDLQFLDDKNKPLSVPSFIAINHELNTIFRFGKSDRPMFKAGSKYTLFYVAEKNVLNYCETTITEESKRLNMQKRELTIMDPQEIKQILNITAELTPKKQETKYIAAVERPEKYKGKNVIWFEALGFE